MISLMSLDKTEMKKMMETFFEKVYIHMRTRTIDENTRKNRKEENPEKQSCIEVK